MKPTTLFFCFILFSLSDASPFEDTPLISETYDKIKKITWDSWPKYDGKDVQMVVSVSNTTPAYPKPAPTYKTTTTTTTTTTQKPPKEQCATSFSHHDILILTIVRNKTTALKPIVLDPSHTHLKILARKKYKIPAALKNEGTMILNLDKPLLSLLPPIHKGDIVLLTILSPHTSKGHLGAKTFVIRAITSPVYSA